MRKNDLTNANSDLKNELSSVGEKLSAKQQQLGKMQISLKEAESEIESLRLSNETNKGRIQQIQVAVEECESKLMSEKSRVKNLKNLVIKYLMTMIDKFSSGSFQFNEHENCLQEELDREVLNYVNLGIKRHHDAKAELENKVLKFQG